MEPKPCVRCGQPVKITGDRCDDCYGNSFADHRPEKNSLAALRLMLSLKSERLACDVIAELVEEREREERQFVGDVA